MKIEKVEEISATLQEYSIHKKFKASIKSWILIEKYQAHNNWSKNELFNV